MSEKIEEEIAAAKANLRKAAAEKRASLIKDEPSQKSYSACTHFIDALVVKPGETVAAYWPIGDELDCKPLIKKLHALGVIVALPSIVGAKSPLVMREFEGENLLVPAQFGTMEPRPEARQIIPDIIILPLLAFDKTGARLGYGGGFYDRTLSAMKTKPKLVGMGFDIQEVGFVPVSSHDMPLDMIVTETGLRRFN